MNTIQSSQRFKFLLDCFFAGLVVLAVTALLFLIGRSVLGEGVIALTYLLPIAWSAGRWGRIPGIIAAVTATLCFDFLFIPPFYTFVVGNLEGWLVLGIFLAVAVVVVERIQDSLSRAREATLMYELSAELSIQRTQEAIALTVARQLQQLYQARLVSVTYRSENPLVNTVISFPGNGQGKGKPDRILPVQNTYGLVGEIQIWSSSYMDLPAENNRLLQNFSWQAGRAFERALPLAAGNAANSQILASQAK